MKKRLFLSVAALTAVLSLSACTGDSGNTSGSNTSGETSLASSSEAQSYQISLPAAIEGVEVTVSSVSAKEGDTVVVTVKNNAPTEKAVEHVYFNGTEISGVDSGNPNEKKYSFVMPAQDVEITIECSTLKKVVVAPVEHAKVEVSNENPKVGEEVAITVTETEPEDYFVKSVSVNGKALEADKSSTEHVKVYKVVVGEVDLNVSVEMQEIYKVKLPTVDGIKVEASNEVPAAGDSVKLYVTNENPSAKRVDAVKVNDGEALEGKHSNVANCMIYEFVMPEGQHAQVSFDVKDVFEIKVAADLSDKLALPGMEPAAEGEEVSFKPACFAGYWFNNIRAVEEDVVISEDAEHPGYYKFTMPAHEVTITADTGVIEYAVTCESSEYYRVSYARPLDAEGQEQELKDYYAPGEQIKVKVDKTGNDADVVNVKANGEVLPLDSKDEEGYYLVSMPASNLVIEPVLEYHYKTFEVVNNEHFNLEVKVREEDGTLSPAENRVLSLKEVIITTTDANDEVGKLVVDSLKVYAGADAASAVELTSAKVVDNQDGTFTFTTNSTDMYYKFEVASEVEAALKNKPIVGTYSAGHRMYYSSNYTTSVSKQGIFTFSNTDYILVPVENDEGHYKVLASVDATSEKGHLFVNGDYMLFFDGNSNSSLSSNVYLYAKNRASVGLSSSNTRADNIYSIIVTDKDSKSVGAYMNVKFGSDVASCYLDIATLTVKWNVSLTNEAGKDGLTMEKDDLMVIKDSAGEVITQITMTDINTRYGDGFRHKGVVTVADKYVGTYTCGEVSFELDGFEKITVGELTGRYEEVSGEENMIYTIVDGREKYYVLDIEAKTAVESRGPKDGYQGVYTHVTSTGDSSSTIELNGYGETTVNEVQYTYKVSGPLLILTDAESNKLYFTYDKANMTVTDREPVANEYVGRMFTLNYQEDDGWDSFYYYTLILKFKDDVNCEIKGRWDTASRDYVFNGTYTVGEDGKITITLVDAFTETMVLEKTSTGALKFVTTSSYFYLDTDFNIPTDEQWTEEI